VFSAKKGFTESWSFGSRQSSWLTVKTLFFHAAATATVIQPQLPLPDLI
jgi:hypothetical protein